MGAALFERCPEIVRCADRILGYSIIELCTQADETKLRDTRFAQVAIFVVSELEYRDALDKRGAARPTWLAGHSVGELNALVAGGMLDFEAGLRIVKRRAELMAACEQGTMAAVSGLSLEKLRTVLSAFGFSRIDIANQNSPTQTTIAGSAHQLASFSRVVQAAGARYYPLNVSGAFHSRYMRPAKQELAAMLADVEVGEPVSTIIANVTAKPYTKETLKTLLVEQLDQPVRWTESIGYLLDQGVTEFEQFSGGQILIGFARAVVDARGASGAVSMTESA
jgi:malonyl CoA-acyl carrier protein transacylase